MLEAFAAMDRFTEELVKAGVTRSTPEFSSHGRTPATASPESDFFHQVASGGHLAYDAAS